MSHDAQATMELLNPILEDFDRSLESQLDRSFRERFQSSKDRSKRTKFRWISTLWSLPLWKWWFFILIPVLLALYFGFRDSIARANPFKLDKEIAMLNMSTSQEILALKQKLEETEVKHMEEVRRLIQKQLQMYDADKTGMPDYALESSGAYVIGTRDTIPHKETAKLETVWGIPLWSNSVNPRTVIQRKAQGINAGECWSFVGGHGYLTINLSKRIIVKAVSYEHLPKALSPSGDISSAPKEFIVWSYQNSDNKSSKFELGRFFYDIDGESLQSFKIDNPDPRGTPIVELEVLSNNGDRLTCLYRFRVHGEPLEDK